MRTLISALFVFPVTYLIYVYPAFVLGHLLFGSAIHQLSSVLLAAGLSVLIFVYLRTHLSTALVRGLTHYGMGFGFLGFCVFNLGLLAASIWPEARFETGLVAVLAFGLLSGFSLYQGRVIQTKSLVFESSKVTRPVSLIFISDVHLGSTPKRHLENLCAVISQFDYDMLLIGGDLFDSSAFQTDDLSPFLGINRPIYFVTGNHEYYVRHHRHKLEELNRFNISVLDNQTAAIGPVNLIGISDNQSPDQQVAQARARVQKDSFNLLAVHKPTIWDRISGEVDLMVSGHTHNGQIFPFNLIVRLQFRTVYGLFRTATSALYVSSGSGTWGPRMRLGTQNEVVKIDIQPPAR